jgi:acetoin utilization deacetylase AcuC-like enzyme
LHHGDGTQAIFAHDPTVYHISIHSAADLYMAVAAGMRHGNSTTAELLGHCNIPLLHATYPDEFWQRIDENGRFYRAADSLTILQEKLETLPFQPDLLFIFSGYDAHVDDRGKDITNWTNQDYEYLTRLVLRVAQRAGCPVLSQHGGGYNLPVTVSAALSHVHVLADTGH